jgi:predicted glycosyltransferase
LMSTLPRVEARMNSRRWRLVLYSHDAMGIGHMRRNQLIARTLAGPPSRAEVLLIAGAKEASAFPMPAGVDCLTLPSLRKEIDGRYCSRHLDIPLADLVELRARVIGAAVEAFEPDVLIVDKVPRGVGGELDRTLKDLRAGGRTRCLLGLRDILDDPDSVRREWWDTGAGRFIDEHYDGIWVYGDPAVYDPVNEYDFPAALAAKVTYTGYLDRQVSSPGSGADDPAVAPDLGLAPGPLALCMVGGGEDGARLAEAFARAELTPEVGGVIVAGPYMPAPARRRLHDLAAGNPRLRVLEFLTEPEPLLARADRVVTMGGYNTVCEVLSSEKRALIVPRVEPRGEQLIRAERLRDLGLIDMLRPDELTPGRLAEWLARAPGAPTRARDRIDLGGLARLPHLLDELLGGPVESVLHTPSLNGVAHAVP